MQRKHSWPLIICGVVLLGLALIGPGRSWAEKDDVLSIPLAGDDSYIFRLQLGGETVEDYTECLGLGSSNAIQEATGVTDAGIVFIEKTPGTLQWQNITLRRDGPGDVRLWQWRRAMEEMNLDVALRNGTIVMLTAGSAEPVAQWAFRNGWAARLSFSGSREELVIAHDGLERIGAAGPWAPPSRR